jgi:hypothetical protein
MKISCIYRKNEFVENLMEGGFIYFYSGQPPALRSSPFIKGELLGGNS